MASETLGARITSSRERRGLSQLDVARALKVSPASVCGWEADLHIPRLPTLKALAKLLAVSVGGLVDGPIPARSKSSAA